MHTSCPECHTHFEFKKKIKENRIHCKKCNTVFLTPVQFMEDPLNNENELNKTLKQLKQEFNGEQKKNWDKFNKEKKQIKAAFSQKLKDEKTYSQSESQQTVKTPIARTLLKTILLFYFLVVLTVNTTHMMYEYNKTKIHITRDLKASEKIFGKGLGEATWNLDEIGLHAIISGMLEHPVIIGIKIEDAGGQWMGAGGIIIDEKGKYITYKNKVSTDPTEKPVYWDIGKKGNPHLLWTLFSIIYSSDEGEKNVAGKATIYSSEDYIFDRVKGGFILLLINTFAVALALVITFLWVSRRTLTRPLSVLTNAVTELNLNNLDTLEVHIPTSHKNELKVLEESFNQMVINLIEEQKNTIQISKTFEKFIPKQFLSRIADGGISTIKLGSMEKERLTVLYAEIKNYQDLSSRLNDEQLFNQINHILSAIEPKIEKHGGFIYKFNENGIIALFALEDRMMEALSAVYAAIDMQKELNILNEKKIDTIPFIYMGIGIHSDDLRLGTIGNDTRIESSAMGPALYTAIKLYETTKRYNSQIIISEDTYSLSASFESFQYREIDKLKFEGMVEPIGIFEIFDADSLKNLKSKILSTFNEGIHLYRTQQWKAAVAYFEQCLQAYPTDTVSQIYIKRCMSPKTEIVGIPKFLKDECKLFQSMQRHDDITKIAPNFREIHIEKNQLIIKQGDVDNDFYIIFSGSVENFEIDNKGKIIPLSSLKRGDCFGEESILYGQPSTSVIKSVTYTHLLAMKKENFHLLLREFPILNNYFHKKIYQQFNRKKTIDCLDRENAVTS